MSRAIGLSELCSDRSHCRFKYLALNHDKERHSVALVFLWLEKSLGPSKSEYKNLGYIIIKKITIIAHVRIILLLKHEKKLQSYTGLLDGGIAKMCQFHF